MAFEVSENEMACIFSWTKYNNSKHTSWPSDLTQEEATIMLLKKIQGYDKRGTCTQVAHPLISNFSDMLIFWNGSKKKVKLGVIN